MPGLQDLPPELIEQIFELTEEYVFAVQGRAGRSWNYDEDAPPTTPKLRAPLFRCTSRYIERATRRVFIDAFFDFWHIRAADDQSIQKFCNIINTSDLLAKGLKELNLYMDDDRMIPMRLGKNSTHVFDSETQAIVPVAYFQNRQEIVQALSGCENHLELYFYRSFEHEPPQKRATAANDSDEEDLHDRLSQLDIEIAGHGENNVTGGDVEAIPDEHQFWACEGQRWFDIGTSLAYVLSLATMAGAHIKCVSTELDYVSVTDCAGLAKHKNVMPSMDQLYLDIDCETQESNEQTPKAWAISLGIQLRMILENTPALRKLTLLSQCEEESVRTWELISKVPAIPTLEELSINWFVMHFQDFADFILKHKKTLRVLSFDHVEMPDGHSSGMGRIYDELSKEKKLESIYQRTCYYGRHRDDRHFDIPMHLLKPWSMDEEDDDGFIWVKTEDSTISWKGKDLVHAVLKEMAAHMCSK